MVLFFFNWRANFILLFLLGFIALLSVCFIPETNKHKTYKNLHLISIKKNITTLFSNRFFVGYVLCRFATYAAILAWLTTCPILLHFIGVSPICIGWLLALEGVAFVLGGFINARLVGKYGDQKMIYCGLTIIMLAGVALFIFGMFDVINVISVMLPVFVYMFGASLVSPNAFAGAMKPFPKIAGITVAVIGAVQVLGGFVSSSIIALSAKESLFPLAGVFIVCAIIILVMSKTLLAKNN